MGLFNVAIIYRPPGGRPLSLATIDDPGLLRSAAALALSEASGKAVQLSVLDPVLGQIQGAEAEKLRRILGMFSGS